MNKITAVIREKPVLTYSLMAINIIIALYITFETHGYKSLYYDYLYNYLSLSSSKVIEGEWWRFLSAAFIHFDTKHLGYNLLSLYALGSFLEHEEGRVKFIAIYFLSGIFGNIVSFALNYEFSGGASGAIYGLAGIATAQIIRLMFGKDLGVREFARNRWWMLLLYPAILILPGFADPRINNASHISGMFAGLVLALVFTSNEYKYSKLIKLIGSCLLIGLSAYMFIIGFDVAQN